MFLQSETTFVTVYLEKGFTLKGKILLPRMKIFSLTAGIFSDCAPEQEQSKQKIRKRWKIYQVYRHINRKYKIHWQKSGYYSGKVFPHYITLFVENGSTKTREVHTCLHTFHYPQISESGRNLSGRFLIQMYTTQTVLYSTWIIWARSGIIFSHLEINIYIQHPGQRLL